MTFTITDCRKHFLWPNIKHVVIWPLKIYNIDNAIFYLKYNKDKENDIYYDCCVQNNIIATNTLNVEKNIVILMQLAKKKLVAPKTDLEPFYLFYNLKTTNAHLLLIKFDNNHTMFTKFLQLGKENIYSINYKLMINKEKYYQYTNYQSFKYNILSWKIFDDKKNYFSSDNYYHYEFKSSIYSNINRINLEKEIFVKIFHHPVEIASWINIYNLNEQIKKINSYIALEYVKIWLLFPYNIKIDNNCYMASFLICCQNINNDGNNVIINNNHILPIITCNIDYYQNLIYEKFNNFVNTEIELKKNKTNIMCAIWTPYANKIYGQLDICNYLTIEINYLNKIKNNTMVKKIKKTNSNCDETEKTFYFNIKIEQELAKQEIKPFDFLFENYHDDQQKQDLAITQEKNYYDNIGNNDNRDDSDNIDDIDDLKIEKYKKRKLKFLQQQHLLSNNNNKKKRVVTIAKNICLKDAMLMKISNKIF